MYDKENECGLRDTDILLPNTGKYRIVLARADFGFFFIYCTPMREGRDADVIQIIFIHKIYGKKVSY